MSTMKEKTRQLKLDSPKLAALSEDIRNAALLAVADALVANKDAIFAANQKDLKKAEEDNLDMPVRKRLKFDQAKLDGVVDGIRQLVNLPDPLGKNLMVRELDEGLTLYRQSCPIGVIGVIFESRPDALVQIATLCIKSGNCAILKGGSEAMNSNAILFETIYNAAVAAGLPKGCMTLAQQREEIRELLDCYESVDLLIPRGSNAFVQYIMNNTKIPVMGHADGICHVYVDKAADLQKAIRVVVDSKTQYVSVCNATETLLVHRDILKEFMPALSEALRKKNVELRATKEVRDASGAYADEMLDATEEDFSTEYLDYILSIKEVSSVEEAIDHINRYGSHHTDAIVTEDAQTAQEFMQLVDSAGVFWNASTRFSDGYRYGFGAEVGISTGKLHARGPVGLEGLVTYKYKLIGDGHIVDDYSTGVKQFHHKDLI